MTKKTSPKTSPTTIVAALIALHLLGLVAEAGGNRTQSGPHGGIRAWRNPPAESVESATYGNAVATPEKSRHTRPVPKPVPQASNPEDVVTANLEELLFTKLITPCRYLDTRLQECVPGSKPIDEACPVGAFKSGETRQYLVQASTLCPVPLWAKAIIATVTAVDATGRGHLLLYDATLWERPLASTLNFQQGTAVANTTIAQLGQVQGYPTGEYILPDLAIHAMVTGGGRVHVVLDVLGYMEALYR